MSRSTLVAALLFSTALASAHAEVTVEFANPDRFSDAGDRSHDPVETVKALADYMRQAADRVVPAGTVVRIEVLDLDRAGHTRLNLPTETRIMSDRADAPCMDLRYTVGSAGQAGEARREHFCDLNYMRASDLPSSSRDDPLFYEKRMVQEWLRKRFGERR